MTSEKKYTIIFELFDNKILTLEKNSGVKVQKEVTDIMAEAINKYETIFVIDATKTEEEISSLVEKFKSLIEKYGEIESVDEWGKRRLAYPINDLTEGYYVLVNFKSKPDFPAELERVYGITDGIIRDIVVKCEED